MTGMIVWVKWVEEREEDFNCSKCWPEHQMFFFLTNLVSSWFTSLPSFLPSAPSPLFFSLFSTVIFYRDFCFFVSVFPFLLFFICLLICLFDYQIPSCSWWWENLFACEISFMCNSSMQWWMVKYCHCSSKLVATYLFLSLSIFSSPPISVQVTTLTCQRSQL